MRHEWRIRTTPLKNKKISLKKSLFLYYAGIVLAIVVILYTTTITYTVFDRKAKISDLQTSICDSLKNAINLEIEKMSIVSMNVLYSKTIRGELRDVDPETANIRIVEPIYEAISSIIGPYGTVTQVNIHSVEDFSVGWGVFELFKQQSLGEQEWYQEVKALSGSKFLTKPQERTDFEYYNKYLKGHYFLSLCRIFFGINEEEGAIEVIQNCTTFFKYVNNVKADNPEMEILILNQNDEVIYPFNLSAQEIEEITNNLPTDLEKATDETKTYYKNRSMVSYTCLEDINWKILVRQDKAVVYKSLNIFIISFLMIGMMFLVLVIYICYRISNSVLLPLYQLQTNIENIDLNNILNNNSCLYEVETNTIEIETLALVFNKMLGKLEASSKDLMVSKTEEIRAKMIATQSMINPHFLFNNLANISVMAEDGMNEEIIELCKNLCDYLRYISADSLTIVDIKSEVFYAIKYLECMKVRFGKRLEFYFDIPKEMEDIKISKLTIQPIIENALKYAFRVAPPWIIHVKGELEENGWKLIVTDNGIGIKDEYHKEIMNNFQKIKKYKDISTMQIGGMGLANIYLRLLLLHGDQAHITLINQESGGVMVVISNCGD